MGTSVPLQRQLRLIRAMLRVVHRVRGRMAGMKRPYYTVVPGLLVLAFTLYNLTAILKTGNRQKEVVYEMSKASPSTG